MPNHPFPIQWINPQVPQRLTNGFANVGIPSQSNHLEIRGNRYLQNPTKRSCIQTLFERIQTHFISDALKWKEDKHLF